MASVKGEIDRLVTAKTNIEKAIEECGVDVPNTALISTYADYIRAIPTTIFSQLNANSVGGNDAYIESISQSNGVISAAAGGLATTTKSGLLSTSDKTKLDTINAGTAVGTQNKLAYYSENTKIASYTDSDGSGTKGIYIKDGVPTEMTYSLNATVNSGTVSTLAYYSGTNAVSSLSSVSAEAVVRPIGLDSGVPKLCKWGSFTDSDSTIRRIVTASNVSASLYTGTPYIWQGAIHASNGFYQSSDNRLKCFYDDVEVDLDKLATLSKKYFKWKSGDNNTHIGVSAQELQDLYPEIVSENDEGFLQVEYDKLSVIALKAVDVLYQKLNVLEERLNRLESL